MKNINNIAIAVPLVLALMSIAYLGLVVASLLWAPNPVGASSAPDGTVSKKSLGQGDYVWNWDFNGKALNVDSVDWGMRFLFYNNADVDEVKDRLDGVSADPRITPFLNGTGWFQYAAMDDDPNINAIEWDRDSGIKDHPGCDWNWGHMRVYATGSGDRNFNTTWGYYVVATIHQDHENLYNCDDMYRSYESHEGQWISRIEDNLGSDSGYNWTVYDDGIFWDNDVSGILEIGTGSEHHWYQSDGWGVRVHLPSGD